MQRRFEGSTGDLDVPFFRSLKSLNLLEVSITVQCGSDAEMDGRKYLALRLPAVGVRRSLFDG